MNIFLAGIIQGSKVGEDIHAQDWRGPIIAAVERHLPGAKTYCHFTQHPNSITYEPDKILATFEDGLQRAVAADLVIAYIPSASMGTAIEIYEAKRNNTPVISITPMETNWVVRLYSDKIFPDTESFEKYLAAGGADEMKKAIGNSH
ncbi:MAG: hypothetical protein KAR11_02145 [Phycisphaerae bacterium]|nr:hypothetical protein [Phycisphaerae bacterium]